MDFLGVEQISDEIEKPYTGILTVSEWNRRWTFEQLCGRKTKSNEIKNRPHDG